MARHQLPADDGHQKVSEVNTQHNVRRMNAPARPPLTPDRGHLTHEHQLLDRRHNSDQNAQTDRVLIHGASHARRRRQAKGGQG